MISNENQCTYNVFGTYSLPEEIIISNKIYIPSAPNTTTLCPKGPKGESKCGLKTHPKSIKSRFRKPACPKRCPRVVPVGPLITKVIIQGPKMDPPGTISFHEPVKSRLFSKSDVEQLPVTGGRRQGRSLKIRRGAKNTSLPKLACWMGLETVNPSLLLGSYLYNYYL